jgi:hypothetical protein
LEPDDEWRFGIAILCREVPKEHPITIGGIGGGEASV